MVGLSVRWFMLDYLQAVSLLALIVAHFFLVRGCFSIKEELPLQGGLISGRLDRTGDLLDEVAQLLADLADGLGGGDRNLPPAHPPSGLGDLLTAFLNNRMNMGSPHATPSEEWEVFPPNDDPTTPKEEHELDPSGPAIPHR